ncbi:hypothetical protein ABMA27_003828 [Loxostege sticticalis]|uniref:Reverse transcriptase n=1 Tax=Loxostege sticticalis TaxID=481309 RepID=A0ABR3HQG7_LOXSC
MLSKKVRYGESLEHYYYSKINLLNRCKIYGRQAVDCILYGVEDRAVKVGAQAAQFTEPEQVLKYFRTVKVGHVRDRDQSSSRFRNDRRHVSIARPGTSRDGVSNNNIKCFNCNEIGHRSLKCDKPAVKCTYCDKLGHQLEHCYKYKSNIASEREQGQAKDKNEKQVSRLSVDDANDKYIIDIKVDNTVVKCHVDLGSQCSLIKVSKAKELGLNVVVSENLPVLKGIGGNLVVPVGVTTGSVNVQNIIETIDMYVVEDYIVNQPILLGHSFTEKPNIIITKTPTELIFQQIKGSKIPLRLVKQVTIPSKLTIPVLVKSDSQETGYILVHGSLRGPEGSEYYLHPGQYEIKDGRSTLLIYNTSDSPITLNENSLLTRATHKNNANSFGSLETFSLQLNETNLDDIKCGESLTEEERLELQKLLSQYGDRFSQSLKDLGYTNVTEMVIELEDTQPIVYRPYRLSQSERALVRNMVQEMIDSGIARESCSPYASPIVLVQKKTGEKRLYHYPLPRVEDQLDGLSGNTLFTSLDLASGYYQIPISEESRHKTAFVTPDGQFEYNRMPFGLVNAPSVFQRTINKILQEAKIKYAIVYMDDILIPSKNFSEGLQRLEEVLKLLQTGGLTLKLSKCNFFQSKLDFLGFEVSAEGIRPGSRKTEAVSKFPAPRNQHELRQFLDIIPRVARWWVQLQEYDCSIEYRPGSRMTHVDALSRNSVEQTQPECHVLDSFAVEEIGQDWLSTVQSADEEVKRIIGLSSTRCQPHLTVVTVKNGTKTLQIYKWLPQPTLLPSGGLRWPGELPRQAERPFCSDQKLIPATTPIVADSKRLFEINGSNRCYFKFKMHAFFQKGNSNFPSISFEIKPSLVQ